MKAILILCMGFGISLSASAEERELQSCTHKNGYGSYSGQGINIHQARSQASMQCLTHQIEMFEDRNGRVPSDDEADLFLSACLNICD